MKKIIVWIIIVDLSLSFGVLVASITATVMNVEHLNMILGSY